MRTQNMSSGFPPSLPSRSNKQIEDSAGVRSKCIRIFALRNEFWNMHADGCNIGWQVEVTEDFIDVNLEVPAEVKRMEKWCEDACKNNWQADRRE